MKIIFRLILATLSLSIFMLASAQTPPQSTPQSTPQSPLDAPPQLNNLEEGAPTVTQGKKEHTPQTVQTTQNGQQTEIKVTNEVGTYIVKPNQTVGTSIPGDAQSSSNHAVQWVVKTWGENKNPDPTAAPPVLPENPENQTSGNPK